LFGTAGDQLWLFCRKFCDFRLISRQRWALLPNRSHAVATASP
jgi:hypothetical protein